MRIAMCVQVFTEAESTGRKILIHTPITELKTTDAAYVYSSHNQQSYTTNNPILEMCS